MTADKARALFPSTSAEGFNTPFKPNTHPGAQWYPKAGFGLFIHWGIYSEGETNPSWSMIKNCFGKERPARIPLEDYYKLADRFNPDSYDPNVWMAMAKSLQMQYAVLTTKHHDGYCLWPTQYGKYNTRTHMEGRDLVRDYVQACRKHNIKVGFYFSPRDWAYNDHISGFNNPARKFDHYEKAVNPFSEKQNEIEYDKWLDYTVGQLSELLTQYGQIDVLWFDGAGWMGIKRPEDDLRIRNWIYRLQPQIVINPRWGGKNINPDYQNHKEHHSLSSISRRIGDFYTYESKWPEIEKRNEGLYADIWFEFCKAWKGHWGYAPASSSDAEPKSMRQIIHQLSVLRSFGGNYLLNVGPSGEGEIRPDIFAEADVLSRWMTTNGESIIGAEGVKTWESISNCPLTRRDNILYAHLTHAKYDVETVQIKLDKKPKSVKTLSVNTNIPFDYDPQKHLLKLTLSSKQKDPLNLSTVIKIIQ